MTFTLVAACKVSATNFASEWFFSGVCSHVGRQMIAATEHALTQMTLERFLTGVGPHVTRQLVRPVEPTIAHLDRAGCGRSSRGILPPWGRPDTPRVPAAAGADPRDRFCLVAGVLLKPRADVDPMTSTSNDADDVVELSMYSTGSDLRTKLPDI